MIKHICGICNVHLCLYSL